jgi:5-enolpyruvylshikimate-3-phosphate synthase
MSLAIAGLIAENPININDFDCVNISYPRFLDTLNTLR